MDEIEINELVTKTSFIKFRIVSLCLIFLVLYAILFLRAFQLQILANESRKTLYKQEQAKTLEARKLINGFQHSLDKLSAEQEKQITDILALGVEKTKLQKDINELEPKYNRLSNDVEYLKKTLKDLSLLQEKEAERIIKVFNQNNIKEQWPSFFVNFLAGVVTSIIASIIYNSAVIRRKMTSIAQLIKIIKNRLIHMKKELTQMFQISKKNNSQH